MPQLETVAQAHNVSLSAQDAPSLQASKRIGKVFHEFDSDSAAMIVLEGDQPLGADAHRYYDGLIRKLSQDTKHVQHIQDFWGDPLTAAGAQSPDGKAVYVQLNLVGNQGETLSNTSVAAVRKIVDSIPAPNGVKAYVTGPAAIAADGLTSGDKTVVKILITTVADISYFEVNSDPQNSSAVVGDVVAQGDIDSIGCRIVVDGQVKAERIRTK